MTNPIDRIFDTRDLMSYVEFIQEQLSEMYNNEFEDKEDFAELDQSDFEDFDWIENLQFYTEFKKEFSNDLADFKELLEFYQLLSETPDFEYGETVISEDEFLDYCKEMLEDIGYIPKDLPSWIEIDFEATSENMKADYFSVDFDNNTYFVRA